MRKLSYKPEYTQHYNTNSLTIGMRRRKRVDRLKPHFGLAKPLLLQIFNGRPRGPGVIHGLSLSGVSQRSKRLRGLQSLLVLLVEIAGLLCVLGMVIFVIFLVVVQKISLNAFQADGFVNCLRC